MFGKYSMDDVTSVMSQNCGERKTKRKGKCWYIYSRIGSSPSLVRWQFGRTDTKYAAPTGPTESSLRHYLCFKTFHKCLTKMAALRGPRESSGIIVGTYLPFFSFVFSGLSPPWILPSWLFLTYLIFKMELSKFRRPSNIQNMLYWAFWIAVVPVFLIHHFRNKKKMLSLYV